MSAIRQKPLGKRYFILSMLLIPICFDVYINYTYGSFQQWEIYMIPLVIGVNFVFTLGVWIIFDKLKRQQLQLNYIRLLTSLGHFSSDLGGIMNEEELEKRLVGKIQTMCNVKSVSILEIDSNSQEITWKYGVENETASNEIRKIYFSSQVPMCELQEMISGYFLKIRSNQGKDNILHIGEELIIREPVKIWLQTLTWYVNVVYDNLLSRSWSLRLIFNLSESERKHLSRDLHDGALQEQIIWYRELEAIKTGADVSMDMRRELEKVSEGLLDVIYQIRLTCNELHPPMLKEFGLIESLENLFESTELRVDYEVLFDSSGFESTLNDEQLIGIFRIVQELLANATKHSKADTVQISLFTDSNLVVLKYKDNGIGTCMYRNQKGFEGMGIRGMKERVRSLEGKIDFESSHNGLSITISLPAVQSDLSEVRIF